MLLYLRVLISNLHKMVILFITYWIEYVIDLSNIFQENNNVTPYSNPELDMIGKDIEELVKEKLTLESEIIQKEADIKIKNGEVKSLQVRFSRTI